MFNKLRRVTEAPPIIPHDADIDVVCRKHGYPMVSCVVLEERRGTSRLRDVIYCPDCLKERAESVEGWGCGPYAAQA